MPYITKTLITSEGCDASREKRLSICLLADGFSFAQLSLTGELQVFGEAGGGHAPGMTDISRNLKAYFAETGIRPLQYSRMQMTVFSNECVWVPDELYRAGNNRQYMKLAGGSGQGLMTAQCHELASTAVFAASDQLVTAFKVALPGLTVANQHVRMAGLAETFGSANALLINWREGYIDIAAYRDRRYVYGNTLLFTDDSTALFHLVDIMKTYGLEGEGTRLMMCGDVTRERYATFSPYFPEVSLFNGTSKIGGPFRTFHAYRHALILV